MKTILQSGLTQRTISSAELDPLVAVSDNHLLVNTRPSRFGVFKQASAGNLPAIAAKHFRITNSGSSNVIVNQKTPLLLRTFDNSIDVGVDSNTIRLQAVESYTPNGQSKVLRITHAGDSAAFESVQTTESFFGFQAYFKINSIGWTYASNPDFTIKPIGIYTNKQAIDTNLPALSLGIGKNSSENPRFVLRTGIVNDETLPSAILDRWYRVDIQATEASSNFVLTVSIEDPAFSGEFSQAYTKTVTSTGAGMLDEIFAQNSFVIGMASDGESSQDIESLFVYRDVTGEEELLPSTTKEYFCIQNLDEYTVSGAVTGYHSS